MQKSSAKKATRILAARTAPMHVVRKAIDSVRGMFPGASITLMTQAGTEDDVRQRIKPDFLVTYGSGFFRLRHLRLRTYLELFRLRGQAFLLVDSGTSGGTFFSWKWLAFFLLVGKVYRYRSTEKLLKRERYLFSVFKAVWKALVWIIAGALLLTSGLIGITISLVLRLTSYLRKLFRKKGLRVLYVSHEANLNGAPISLLETLTALDRTSLTPIVNVPERGPLAERLRDINVEVTVIPTSSLLRQHLLRHLMLRDLFRFIGAVPRLVALIIRKGVDIVHTNSIVVPDGAAAAWLCGVRRVWHFRDSIPQGGLWRKFQLSILSILSHRIIAVSEHVVAESRTIRPASKVSRIYDGLSLERFSPTGAGSRIRGELRIPNEAFCIAVVGQISPLKGVHLLLEGMPRLLREVPEAVVLIIGEATTNDYTEYLESIIQENSLEQSVVRMGFREDIPALLEASDVVCIPSLQEAFGRLAIEGMAMSRPVVAFAVGGLKETVIDGVTGMLVPGGDKDALTDALIRLARDPGLRNAMGAAGRRLVVEEFDVRITARKIRDLYSSLLKRKR
jgi:glycosyltransferase involved in cell wall biosynthesis